MKKILLTMTTLSSLDLLIKKLFLIIVCIIEITFKSTYGLDIEKLRDDSTVAMEVTRSYGAVEAKISLEKIHHGVANDVLFVKSGDRPLCILKCYQSSNLDLIEGISGFVNILRTTYDIPSPEIKRVFKTVDEKVIILMDCCPGESVFFDLIKRTAVAELMAKIHTVRKDCPFNSDLLTFPQFDFLFSQCQDWKEIETVGAIFNQIDKSYLKRIPSGLIHGDFSFSNLLFEKNHISGILDFDNVRTSYLLTDLARAQIFYGFDEDYNLIETNIIEFLSSYEVDVNFRNTR
jgi:Ser/Thr protein kinase RdoA (MazF antagonist)